MKIPEKFVESVAFKIRNFIDKSENFVYNRDYATQTLSKINIVS